MNPDGRGVSKLALIIILGIITAFDAMAIDMYLPGFQEIGQTLGADAGTMQMSLSVFVGGLAVGQLFYGPLTDRYGRRSPLAIGLLLFVMASVLAALSSNTAVFMVARAVQGLGAAAGLVIPRAIITDRYEGREVGKLFAALLQVMTIAPIIAPPIGGLLLAETGWRSIFWLLATIGAASIIVMLRSVPETLKPSHRTTAGIGAAMLNYLALFRHGDLIWLILSSAFAMAGLFAYIGSSAFVFINHFGLSPTIYSLVLAGNAVGMVIGGQINVLLLNRWTERQLLRLGCWLFAGSSIALVCATVGSGSGVYVTGGLILLAMVSLVFVLGNGIALVMQSAPAGHIGSVSSLLGVLQYLFAGITGAALGFASNDTLIPFVVGLLFCAICALAAFQIAMRKAGSADRQLSRSARL
jgi:DHA1 family bicyclomycin/chloramphenicol resistance-like MFS transporter